MAANFRARLRPTGPGVPHDDARPIIANFSLMPSPAIPELLAAAGFDAIVIDLEHGPLGPESLNVMIPAARGAGLVPLVRVRANEPSLIGQALDAGASGVVVPQIESATAAAAAVDAARFAPEGRRGVNPFVRAAGYTAGPDWFARANREVAVLAMVEGTTGIAALPAILDVPGLDAVFVGPFDLSQALGRAGEVEHPEVVDTIRDIVEAARARGIATAVFASTPAAGRRWLDLGVRLVALGTDTQLALQGFRAACERLRQPDTQG